MATLALAPISMCHHRQSDAPNQMEDQAVSDNATAAISMLCDRIAALAILALIPFFIGMYVGNELMPSPAQRHAQLCQWLVQHGKQCDMGLP